MGFWVSSLWTPAQLLLQFTPSLLLLFECERLKCLSTCSPAGDAVGGSSDDAQMMQLEAGFEFKILRSLQFAPSASSAFGDVSVQLPAVAIMPVDC